jgi:YfiH family protein
MPGSWLTPEWPSAKGINAFCSLARDVSDSLPWGSFNTADHVGDDPSRVAEARFQLVRMLAQPHPPLWLDQVHGIKVVRATVGTARQSADAVYTDVPGMPITIHTADCLPLFLAAADGSEIALVHGGWRGLAAGIIPAAMASFRSPPENVFAWLGPAIGPDAFEVGEDVREVFMAADGLTATAFRPGQYREGRQHWMCDLYAIARRQLQLAGVNSITGGDYCTFSDKRFFSYRRRPVTGRMLSLMWITPIH